MRNTNVTISVITVVMILLSLTILAEETKNLPGRVENTNLYTSCFGDCDVFFYMTPEKDRLARSLQKSVLEDLNLTFARGAPHYPTLELKIRPPEEDYHNKMILDNIEKQSFEILNDYFNLDIQGKAFYINTDLNWEGLKIHKDSFYQQYDYITENGLNSQSVLLIQDITLCDLQMEIGTVSGTLWQDGLYGDRYIIAFFPTEVVGTFFLEPPMDHYVPRTTMPYHSTIPPMDFRGDCTSGSSKGKRMSQILRGVVSKESIKPLKENAIVLSINRKNLDKTGTYWYYENGLILKSLPLDNYELDTRNINKIDIQENVDIHELSTDLNINVVQVLDELFQIGSQNLESIKIYRLVKKDGGFSPFRSLNLNIPSDSKVILLNNSSIPENYHYFNLAEIGFEKNLPWIQLYRFQPSEAMQVPTQHINNLSLTPIEELIYRNEITDNDDVYYPKLNKKIYTCIDMFVFSAE